MSNEAKLAELSAKTDRELSRYLANELARGVRLASESSSRSQTRAVELYHEILRLLPMVRHIDRVERRTLQANLTHLQELLDQLPAMAGAAC